MNANDEIINWAVVLTIDERYQELFIRVAHIYE